VLFVGYTNVLSNLTFSFASYGKGCYFAKIFCTVETETKLSTLGCQL
jgi:hypothetical protein